MKIKFNKGLDLKIAGAVASDVIVEVPVSQCAITLDDFPGFVPKVAAKAGTAVQPGSPLLYDKNNPVVKIVSPIAGVVKDVVRGDRRKILYIEVEAKESDAEDPVITPVKDADSARRFLAESGMLALMRRRPFDIVPDPDEPVRDIFVTGFDSAPLADSVKVLNTLFKPEDYEAGIEVLNKITSGKVYVSVRKDHTFGPLKGAQTVVVEGANPAGMVSFQIAAIAPINKGDVVWTLDIATLGRIGKLVRTGTFEMRTVVAITGPEVKKTSRGRVLTKIGAPIDVLLKNRLVPKEHNRRIISGNVLTGVAVGMDQYLRFPYRQICVIAEGDDVDEFMGWASMSTSKMSTSRSFPGHFLKRLFRPDARLNGGRRAMIMSGEYDSVMPIDILPEYLIKAIIAKDIDQMEKLGIYEIAPEDFALAEYVDTSKLPLQQIVRDGIDYLRKELE
ncbi:MAG: NADH:ubiquinone reductase (Na(+)-transporting) subunit A [Bacteroidales bacterium]|nr:NADH:ubiquinone reductase (Na(+)-transporting) subunit A [Bacteroidales bacterium]